MQTSEKPILQTRELQLTGAVGSLMQWEAAQHGGRASCCGAFQPLLLDSQLGDSGKLLNPLLLLFPPPPLRVEMNLKWGNTHEGISVNAGCALTMPGSRLALWI